MRRGINMAKFHHLESAKIEDAAKKISKCVKQYKDIVSDTKKKTNALFDNWHGEGKTAFEHDFTNTFRQLSDIQDIMDELYDFLIDAGATYVLADEETAKNMTLEG